MTLNAGRTLEQKPTENLEAYQLYLQGRTSFSRLNPDSLTKAAEYFNLAIAKDPGFYRHRFAERPAACCRQRRPHLKSDALLPMNFPK